MLKQGKEKNLKHEKIKAAICRWWFVGAVYFFIAFGTNLGNTTTPIDLIFFLGVGVGLGNIFIFHPIMYSVFTIERRGKMANTEYFKRGIKKNVLLSLAEVARCMALVILTYLVYQVGNTVLVQILSLPENTVVVPGEPILFSIIFVFFYILSDGIINTIYKAIETKSE